MPSYTQSLAQWFGRLTLDDVPSDLVAHAKLRILDTLGVALAASSLEYGKVVRDAAQALGGDDGSRIVAFGDRVAAATHGIPPRRPLPRRLEPGLGGGAGVRGAPAGRTQLQVAHRLAFSTRQ